MRVKADTEKANLNSIFNKVKSGNPVPSLHANKRERGGKVKQWHIFFFWAPKSLWTVTAAMRLKDASSLDEKLW